MTKLRVLVVEDSLTVRMYLCELLESDPAFELVGQAEDGKQAIELCLALRPDVISLDMMMPVMTGLAATEYIMAYCPTPILVVSSSVNRGELFRTYEALAARRRWHRSVARGAGHGRGRQPAGPGAVERGPGQRPHTRHADRVKRLCRQAL
ncbi:response regulator [Chromobacterium vaccinii]|uniref:response regulator n=1 Tax=Chromobacterium vaccinii TaxID=1108595 RepID=UPI003261BADD